MAGLAAAEPMPVSQVAEEGPFAVRLHGVVKQQAGGMALLQFGAGRPLTLRVGDSHGGFTLVQLLADGVRMKAPDGETFDVDLPGAFAPAEVGKSPTAPQPSARMGSPAEPPSGAAVLLESPPDIPLAAPASGDPEATGERTFSRDEVRLRLQTELPRILASAVVAPRVLGHEVAGLELVAFPTDTVLGETGLVPGDVLLTVNGRDVRGAESLAVLVQRFQTASQIDLTVDRDGEILPLRYRIE